MGDKNIVSIKVTSRTAFAGVYFVKLKLSESACQYTHSKWGLANEKITLEKYYLSSPQLNELKILLKKINLPTFPKIKYEVFDGTTHEIKISSRFFNVKIGYADGYGADFEPIDDFLTFIFGLQQFDT